MDTQLHQDRSIRRRIGTRGLACMVAAFVAATALPAQALTITPYFGSSITSDPNAALIEGTINDAIQFYNNTFSNPIDVGIVFQQAPLDLGGVASTEPIWYQPSYASYTSALASDSLLHPENTALATAVANLPNDNKADTVYATSAAMRALGFSDAVGGYGTDGVLGHGAVDAVVTLSTIYHFAYSGTPDSTQFDAYGTIQHEIDEVLGIGDTGSVTSFVQTVALGAIVDGQSAVGPMNLYRWGQSGTGTRVPTMTWVNSYFSIDSGVTHIVPFGPGSGDWALSAGCGTVQGYACAAQKVALDLSSPEVIALQAIGYNLAAPVPEPQSYVLMLAGIGLVGGWARRRTFGLRRNAI
jgi:hypothetical protein